MWNPYVLNGTPFWATGVSAVLSPVRLLFMGLSPESMFLWAGWLKMALAGIGIYLFVRTLGLSVRSSVVAGTAFMFSGYQIFYLLFPNTAVSMTFGWGLWATETCCTKKKQYFPVCLAAVTCVACLGGHPESALLVILSWLIYGSVRHWKASPWLIGAVALGISISAVVLIPFTEYVFTSATFAQRSGAARNLNFFPLYTLPGFFIPLWDGDPGDFEVSIQSFTGLFYAGPVILCLAVFSLWEIARKRAVRILWGLLCSSFVLVFGIFPFFDLFTMPPLLRQGNHLHAAQIMAGALSILAGFGIEAATGSQKAMRSVGWTLAGCLAAATLLTLTPGVAWNSLKILGLTVPCWAFWGLVLAGLPAILLVLHSSRLHSVAFVWIAASGILYSSAFLPAESRRPLVEIPEVISVALQQGGHSRFVAIGQGALPPNFGMHWRLRDIRGYESLVSSRVPEFYKALTGGKFDPHQFVTELSPEMLPLLETLGCRLLLSQDSLSLSGLTEVISGPPYLYRLGRSARAQLATRVTSANNPEEAFEHVVTRASPTHIVIEQADVALPSRLGEGSLQWSLDEPDEVELQVDVDADALLILRDTYHRGWQALVDGRTVPMLRADYLFRAVTVPAGVHTVRFEYRPSTFVWGWWVSLAAGTVLLAIVSGRALHVARARSTSRSF